jgi:hypothetical protein
MTTFQTAPLCTSSDVEAKLVRPLSDFETAHIAAWIGEASAQLRQRAPFDIDARMALFTDNVPDPAALNPDLVAGVTATVVKRFLVNPDGAFSSSEGVGPYSRSASFVNRYDKSGSATVGAIQVTDADVEQLRPATPAPTVGSFRVNIPRPELLVPGVLREGSRFGPTYGSVIVPDIANTDSSPE